MPDAQRNILEQVRFEIDENSINSTVGGIGRVQSALSELSNQFVAANETMASSTDNLQSSIDQLVQINTLADSFREEADAENAAAAATENYASQIDKLADSFRNEASYRPGLTNPEDIGYGQEGGLIGPAEDDSDGGGGGSLGGYGVSRGFSSAAALARQAGAGGAAGGLQVTGEILRVGNALGRIAPIITDLNTSIEATPGLLGPLVDGFTALGIPMAGLLAVAAPVAIALVALTAEVGSFLDTIHKGTEGIESDIKQLQEQGKLSAEGATPSLTVSRDKAIEQQANDQAQLTQLVDQRTKIGLDAVHQKDVLAAAADAISIKTLSDEIDKQKKLVDDDKASVNNYNQALSSTQVAANNASEAARKHADALLAAGDRYAQYDQLTGKQVDDQVSKLQQEIDNRKQAIAVLEQNNAAQGTSAYQIDLNNQAIAKYHEEITQDTGDVLHLTNVSHDLAAARDEEKAAADRLKETTKELNKDLDALAKNFADQAKEEADNQQKIVDAESKAYQANEQAQQQHQDAIDKLQLDGYRKEEDLVQQNSDKIADIRTKEAEKEAALWTTYQNQLTDDLTKYNDDRAKLIQSEQNNEADQQLQEQQKQRDLVRTEQESEAKDLLSHEQRLADIRRSAQESEWNAVLDGNFEQLYIDQEHEKQKETDENSRYNDQEAQLRLQLQQQETDESAHYNNSLELQRLHLQQQEQAQDVAFQSEEAQRQVDYDRKLKADRVAEENEITQANTAEDRKLRDLNTWELRQEQDIDASEQRKLQQITQNLGRELQVIQQNYDLRMTLLQRENAAIQTAISNLPTSSVPYSGISAPTEYDDGGDFGAGQGFIMSENRAETLRIAGRSYNVGGKAFVMPLEGGSVDNNKSQQQSRSIGSLQIVLQGVNDPQANARAVSKILDDWAA